ncbi:MAG: hypothetical protein RMJ66_07335 [Bacteroidia bacterium]|nr:hypothetical protein [Bacteroidia bacterium]MDW8134866.1 hypothetical protein [Bacteroidia bacterium]
MTSGNYAQEEKRARQISLSTTFLLFVLFFLLAYYWVLVRGTIPPEDENPYIVVGRLDFGAVPASSTSSFTPSQEEPLITSKETQPVKSPPRQQATPPTETPQEVLPETEESEEEVENEVFQPTSLSDASETSDIGQGLLEFGEGEEGLQNRRLLHFVAPRYNVQKEARIKFELYVLPDGRVSHARALSLQAPPELKQAGEEAIRQWLFSPISTNKIQRMTVVVRFRLR